MEGRSEAWYWLYGSNILFARDESFGHPNLAVTWSLAIEEQFYLLWPLVVALYAAAARSDGWTCAVRLIVTALGLRTAITSLQDAPASTAGPAAVVVLSHRRAGRGRTCRPRDARRSDKPAAGY